MACKHEVNKGLIYWDNGAFYVDCLKCGKKLLALCNGEDIYISEIGIIT